MAHSHKTKTSSLEPPERVLDRLQRVIRSNPLVNIVVGVISVVGVVAGVMTYFTSERIANIEIEHKSEIALIKTTDKAELLAATAPLNQRIEDLNFRLASIERRVPGAGPLYLDITTITKGSDIRQILFSGRYTSYDNDGFYVAVPPGTWKFEITNQLSLINSMQPFMSKGFDLPQFQKLAQALAKSSVFLWQGSSKAQVFANSSGQELDFTFRPSISVLHITSDSLKEQIEAATQIKGDLDLMMKDIKRQLDEAATKLNSILDEAAKTKQNTQETKVIEAAKIKLLNDPTTTARQDKIKVLEDLASTSELTNYILFSELGGMTPQNGAWPLKHHILSIQHKGNVFYIQDQIRIDNVELRIDDGERHHVDNTSVDHEIFFFSKGKDGYLVSTLLPPVPDRADNFTWLNSWLSGLQIPIY
jgi:hypothetical protein